MAITKSGFGGQVELRQDDDKMPKNLAKLPPAMAKKALAMKAKKAGNKRTLTEGGSAGATLPIARLRSNKRRRQGGS